jgi:beta-xylosidase
MTGRKNLARLLSLILIACTALSCQSTTAPEKADIGMTVHSRGADAANIERQFDLMAQMGVKWVRVDLAWAWVESEQGTLDWGYTDKIVDEAKAHSMNVLAVFSSTPGWALAAGSGDPYSRPADLASYGNFTKVAVQRYASRGVTNWEVWNEPNIAQFWPPTPDADEYGRLFRAVAEAIRSVDPKATVLLAGLSPKYDSPDAEISPIDFLEQLYANGSAQLADAIAAHPYSFPALPMAKQQRMVGGFKDLPLLRNVMTKHGDSAKKIWITEFGAPTGTSPNAVSEDNQARTLIEARKQAARWDWVGPLIYYELVDGGTDPGDDQDNFGVFRQNLDPKPAAVALMKAASQ